MLFQCIIIRVAIIPCGSWYYIHTDFCCLRIRTLNFMRGHLYPCFSNVIYFCILSTDEHGSSWWLVVTGFIRVCREDTFWTVAKAPLPWQKSHFDVLRCMCDLPLWGIHISNLCSWTDILTCYQLRHTVMITSGLKYVLYWFFLVWLLLVFFFAQLPVKQKIRLEYQCQFTAI